VNTTSSYLSLILLTVPLLFVTGCNRTEPPVAKPTVALNTEPVPPTSLSAANTKARMNVKCPEAPKMLAQDIIIDAKGRIEGLASLTGASLEGKVSVITKEFISKYKNNDKLLISILLVSTVCETLKGSSTLTDEQVQEEIQKTNAQILKLFSTAAAPDPRTLAKRTDFSRTAFAEWNLIRIAPGKPVKLHIFEPQCDVRVYVSDVLEDLKKDHGIYKVAVPDEALVAKAFENFTHTFSTTDPLAIRGVDNTILVDAGTRKATLEDQQELLRRMQSTGAVVRVMMSPNKRGCIADFHFEYLSARSAEESTRRNVSNEA
jgi:hypothetical protein